MERFVGMHTLPTLWFHHQLHPSKFANSAIFNNFISCHIHKELKLSRCTISVGALGDVSLLSFVETLGDVSPLPMVLIVKRQTVGRGLTSPMSLLMILSILPWHHSDHPQHTNVLQTSGWKSLEKNLILRGRYTATRWEILVLLRGCSSIFPAIGSFHVVP